MGVVVVGGGGGLEGWAPQNLMGGGGRGGEINSKHGGSLKCCWL